MHQFPTPNTSRFHWSYEEENTNKFTGRRKKMVGSARPENIITRVESNNITWQQFTNGFRTEQFKFP